ncbi:hypothetical protein C6988_08265 [Nitrosopumilus sp. b1]|uniref:hypothetical protein n=1 Tax=Nitrosopumilus sp. b1 TaxID=2109907 RepID=UPI0015F55638|nr:hypothetical protein [Nitrosopumilus sp. b1]KAF6242465.1 hypothetical protein C6988_08265 [Nitrosopumilus sp. b1]
MGDYTPKIPIPIQIRKIIFEKFNDTENRFTNDDVFAILKKNNDIDESWTIDDVETYFNEICDKGLARNIAQNFTTIWLKLFDPMEKSHCNACNLDIYLGSSEEKICPNPSCNSTI